MATSTSASSADTTKGFSASRSINLSLGSFSRGRFKNSSSLAFVPNNSLCSISVQLQNNVGTDNATPATQTTTTKKRPHEHPQSISVEEASSRPAAMGTTEVPPPLKIRRPLTGVQPSTLSSSAPQSACPTPVNRSYPPATTTAHSAPFAPSVHRSPSSLPPPSFHHASPSHHAPPASFSAPSSYLPYPPSYSPTPPSAASSSQNTLSLPSSVLSVPPSLSSPSASVPYCAPSNFSSSASLSSQTPSTPSGPTAYSSSFAPSLQPKPQLHIAGFRRGALPSSSSTSSSLAFFSSPSSPSCAPSLPSPIFMADPSSSSSLPPLHSSLSPASSVLKNDVPEHFRYVSPEDVPSSKMWYEEALRRQKEAELAAIAEMEALPDTRDEPSLEEECPDLQLTPSQKQVIDAAKSGESFFFTGCAGTGKSFLLREIVVQLRKLHLPGEVYVTASTGIAACNIGGCTLHAFAGVGLAKGKVERLARRVERDKLSAPRWRKAKVLVIDEISMLPGELFDKLEWIARAIRDDQRPFGGIQVKFSASVLMLLSFLLLL
ncbi:DNA helicase, variant 2 [Balamuthia mandrillaris]